MDKYINNKVNANTEYYRRNKKLRLNIKSCPHCNYETTGPKSSLQAHIWAKHTPENKRPFQCPIKIISPKKIIRNKKQFLQ